MKKILKIFVIMFVVTCIILSCAYKNENANSAESAASNIDDERNNSIVVSKKKELVTYGSFYGNAGETKTPIYWYVLGLRGDNAILLSRDILDCVNYNDEERLDSYENSSIRKYLQKFYEENFTNEEVDNMIKTRKSYVNNLEEDDDYVRLISLSELCLFYDIKEPESGKDYDQVNRDLISNATEYAKKKGVEVGNDEKYGINAGSYHLRDLVDDGKRAMWVGQKGHIYTRGQKIKLKNGDGVRPIIEVKWDYIERLVISEQDLNNEKQREELFNKALLAEERKKRFSELSKQAERLINEPLDISSDGKTCYVHDYIGGALDFKRYGNFKTLDFSKNEIKGIFDMEGMISCPLYYDDSIISEAGNNPFKELEEVNLSGLDTSLVESMASLFNGCPNLKKVTFGNIDTTNVKTMYKMFNQCFNLEEVNFGEKFSTANVENMRGMFAFAGSLRDLDVSMFDTSKVKDFSYMFYRTNIENLDLVNFDTKSAINMSYMFGNMRKVKHINVQSFDTSNVTSFSHMFFRNEELEALDLSSFKTANVKNMDNMFYYCSSLKDLNISNFVCDNLDRMSYMFYFCNSLKKIDLSKWVVKKSNIVMNYAFRYCEELEELDISNIDLSKVRGYDIFDGDTKLINLKFNLDTLKEKKHDELLGKEIVNPIYHSINGLQKNINLLEYAERKKSISNRDIMFMDNDGWEKLLKNEFLVKKNYEYKEFFNYYEEERYNHFPNYVTSDSMLHIYHLYFDYIMKKTESGKLYDKIKKFTSNALMRAKLIYEKCKGTSYEKHAKTVVAYFSVPLKLLDSKIEVKEYVKEMVDSEIELIESHSMAECVKPIFSAYYDYENASEIQAMQDTNYLSYFVDDYTQYKPRGHYDESDKLRAYFKAFMWYGRTNFTTRSDDMIKCSMLLSLAMNDELVLKDYNDIVNTIYYFAGVSDDVGIKEYQDVIKKVYGDLEFEREKYEDNNKLKACIDNLKNLKAGKINSNPLVYNFSGVADQYVSFKLIGQTYTYDAEIFQKLIYDYVDKYAIKDENGNETGETIKRALPDFLDVPAALNSKTAKNILEAEGSFKFPKFKENLEELEKTMANKIKNDKSDILYVKWMRCLLRLIEGENDDGKFQSYMRNNEYKKKSLETFAGSYAELKHDTILYAKQTYGVAECGEGGYEEFYDSEDIEIDTKGYVEPQKELYLDLSDMALGMLENFSKFDMLIEEDKNFLNAFSDLSKKLAIISDKELKNESLLKDEYELIEGYGATIEHLIIDSGAYDEYDDGNPQKSKAIVTDIATTDGIVREIATGNPIRIFVLVKVEDKYKLCSGAAYDFYQFEESAENRMTDIEWRSEMGFDSGLFDGENWYNMDESMSYMYEDDGDVLNSMLKLEKKTRQFQTWTDSYKYDGRSYTERTYYYYIDSCGSPRKINICLDE